MLLQNFINGKWVESSSREQMEDLNPANTREVLCASPLSAAEEARSAVAAAKHAFFAWSHTPAPVRGKILFRALDILRTRANELAETLTREEGKIIADSRGEVQRAMNILEFTAGEGRRLGGATIPSELPSNFIYTL